MNELTLPPQPITESSLQWSASPVDASHFDLGAEVWIKQKATKVFIWHENKWLESKTPTKEYTRRWFVKRPAVEIMPVAYITHFNNDKCLIFKKDEDTGEELDFAVNEPIAGLVLHKEAADMLSALSGLVREANAIAQAIPAFGNSLAVIKANRIVNKYRA